MTWYYVEAGQQAGPVDDVQLEQLVKSGRIKLDTLVWHEGLASWQPYGQLQPGGPASASPPGPSGGVASSAPGADQAVCTECGGLFNIQDTTAYGSVRVCANCKPVLMQKLAEGAKLNTGALVYAGFWTRFAAYFIDGLILGAVNIGISFASGAAFAPAMRTPSASFIALQIVITFINLCIGLTYETVMIGKYGATLGKMACKIKVVTAEGGPVSYPLALGRYFAKILSGLICLIGYIIAGFDEEKRALHDRICSTRVITTQ